MILWLAAAGAADLPAVFRGEDCSEVAQYLVDPTTGAPAVPRPMQGSAPTMARDTLWVEGRWIVSLPDQVRVFEVGDSLDRSWVLAERRAAWITTAGGLVAVGIRGRPDAYVALHDLLADEPTQPVRVIDDDVEEAWVHDDRLGWLTDFEHPSWREVEGLRSVSTPDPSVLPLIERSLEKADHPCDAMVLADGGLPWTTVSTLELSRPQGAIVRTGFTASDARGVVPVEGGLILVGHDGGWHRIALHDDRADWAGAAAPLDGVEYVRAARSGDGVAMLTDKSEVIAWDQRTRLRRVEPTMLAATDAVIAVAGRSGLWVLQPDAAPWQAQVEGTVQQLRWLDDTRLLVLSADRDHSYLATHDTVTRRQRAGRLPLGRARWTVAWADPAHALVSNGMNALLMVELDTGQFAWTAHLRQVVPNDDKALQAIEVLPDGRVLVASSAHAWLLEADGRIAHETTWTSTVDASSP